MSGNKVAIMDLDMAAPGDHNAPPAPDGGMKLRRGERALRFVRAFFNFDKTAAAICHGPWKGRNFTSYKYIQNQWRELGSSQNAVATRENGGERRMR